VSRRKAKPETTAATTAVDDDLTIGETATLTALWGLGEVHNVTAGDVQQRARELGHNRSLTTIRRDLATLVQLDYAKRVSVRYTRPTARRVHYWATRRPGERVPAACLQSDFLMWLWEGRMSYREFWFNLDRWVRIDNMMRQASAEEWAWLASRPLFALHGEPTPDDPTWWEDPTEPSKREPTDGPDGTAQRS
jgi:hypothetical protein